MHLRNNHLYPGSVMKQVKEGLEGMSRNKKGIMRTLLRSELVGLRNSKEKIVRTILELQNST